ncbi:hypothetical protein FHW67_002844 [Herbaspirillum sp. Sphag1AN]|uniref:hypothetical protein n=1 Tax=unclassified Herbaspirillum TaxID=2624150 RepID=UPI00161D7253|nr:MULTISPECIES: hypothetical protein [unclassified Herbaspirillum]MBB3213546.1 hypothetical protein [Herbaspirillum sp. Sphag1AN]MBB3246744.1 hypothetical protein [Herbaspirillum sp. Sphag64]
MIGHVDIDVALMADMYVNDSGTAILGRTEPGRLPPLRIFQRYLIESLYCLEQIVVRPHWLAVLISEGIDQIEYISKIHDIAENFSQTVFRKQVAISHQAPSLSDGVDRLLLRTENTQYLAP